VSDERPVFFTADHHFAHVNRQGTGIIDYCKRPFDDIEVHDAALIERWNQEVPENADVYHLGDFVFQGKRRRQEILDKLHGRVHLLRGNHDKSVPGDARGFVWVKDYFELKVVDEELEQSHLKIVLFHFPLLTWNANMWGSWHLHGHCHGMLSGDESVARLDVGVDTNDFRPYSYGDVKSIFTQRLLKAWRTRNGSEDPR